GAVPQDLRLVRRAQPPGQSRQAGAQLSDYRRARAGGERQVPDRTAEGWWVRADAPDCRLPDQERARYAVDRQPCCGGGVPNTTLGCASAARRIVRCADMPLTTIFCGCSASTFRSVSALSVITTT